VWVESLARGRPRAKGGQNMICAYLSVALLVGLGANALLGWWWADPAAAAVIALVAVREGIESWRGEQVTLRYGPNWKWAQDRHAMHATQGDPRPPYMPQPAGLRIHESLRS
jgi:hypothetical protein